MILTKIKCSCGATLGEVHGAYRFLCHHKQFGMPRCRMAVEGNTITGERRENQRANVRVAMPEMAEI